MNGTNRWEVILAGAGGQGLQLAGTLLGQAAVEYEGRFACQLQSFGVASRGGYAHAEVVIADGEIAYPGVTEPDWVVILSQMAYDRLVPGLPPKSRVLYDADRVVPGESGPGSIGLPLSSTAIRAEAERSVNLVALGALASLAQPVGIEALERTIMGRLGSSAVRAFTAGVRLAETERRGNRSLGSD